MKKIAIIGAGTCGLYLANKLADKDFVVEVFEKKENVFGKVCSGLISERLFDFIEDKDYIVHTINKCLIHYPKKDVWLEMNPTHYVVNRDRVNEVLLEKAKLKGVIFHFNTDVRNLPQGYDKVIMADGAFSASAKPVEMVNKDFYLGLQFFVDEKDDNDFVETWAHETGFFWKIPRGNGIEYGTLGKAHKLYEKLENFCKEKNIPFDREKVQAATIPQGLSKITKGSVAACGDAAGLCKPWSGGGVIWGLTAADMLVKNIDNLEKYEKEVYSKFGFLILKGNFARKLAWYLGNNFPFVLPGKYKRDNDFPLF